MESLLSDLHFWHWLILAVILLMLELTSGSGFILWIAIGSFIVSIVSYLAPSMSWPWQILLFATFSIVACLAWLKYLKKCTEKSDKPKLNLRTEQFIGRTFYLETAIVNGRGKVKIGDTLWVVEGEDLPKGEKVLVTAVDGVLLQIQKAQSE